MAVQCCCAWFLDLRTCVDYWAEQFLGSYPSVLACTIRMTRRGCSTCTLVCGSLSSHEIASLPPRHAQVEERCLVGGYNAQQEAKGRLSSVRKEGVEGVSDHAYNLHSPEDSRAKMAL